MEETKYPVSVLDILMGIIFLIVLTIAIKWFIDLLTGEADCVVDYSYFLVFSHFGLFIFLGIIQNFIGSDSDNDYAWMTIPLYLLIIIVLCVLTLAIGVDCTHDYKHDIINDIPEYLPY